MDLFKFFKYNKELSYLNIKGNSKLLYRKKNLNLYKQNGTSKISLYMYIHTIWSGAYIW